MFSVEEALGWLVRENARLGRRVAAASVSLLESSGQHAQLLHQRTVANAQQEHEARLNALRQDLALKKIMFRLQVCHLQAQD